MFLNNAYIIMRNFVVLKILVPLGIYYDLNVSNNLLKIWGEKVTQK